MKILTSLVVFLSAVLIASIFMQIETSKQLDETIMRGNEIIRAIGNYRKEHKHVPQRLEELQPDYLTDLIEKAPLVGTKTWKYLPSEDSQRFFLGVFSSDEQPIKMFDTTSARWYGRISDL